MYVHSSSRGFTLVELLVVIAIIGMLSSIVLASLSSARNKGGDAAIKQQMRGIVNAAAVYYSTNGDYGPSFTAAACPTSGTSIFFTNSAIRSVIVAAGTLSGAGSTNRCATDGTNYAVSVKLKSSTDHWCIDSRSNAKQITTGTSWTGVTCP